MKENYNLGKDYGNNLNLARKDALRKSKENPSKYYVLKSCFGIYISESKRLHVFAPSDSIHHSYFKGGKEKRFTDAQIANDWAHTPQMT